jgi:hypothetical protein
MSAAVKSNRRQIAGALVMLALMATIPGMTSAAPTDPELLATLEHPRGDIDYEMELGTLHFFDEENAPFAVQVVDGCAVNDHLWVFGVGLSGISMPLTVMDLDTGKSHRAVLPAFEPGEPIGTILETEALPVCGDAPVGGLPTLEGTATLTAVRGRGRDYAEPVALSSEGRDDAYRSIVRGGVGSTVISDGAVIVAIDGSGAYDELVVLTEGRVPKRVEGLVFSGEEGMLPARSELDKALKGITRGRVREASKTARNRRVPGVIVDKLGLKGVDTIHHLRLALDTLGADAYLAEAGWIKEGGPALEPPQPVEERFTVELLDAAGEARRLPLLGPLVGSEDEGRLWRYGDDGAFVEVIDGCELSGSFWTLAGAETDGPLELVVTDTLSGVVATHQLRPYRATMASLSDSSSMPGCG